MRYAREAGIHEGPRTFLRLPETVHLLFYGKITDWHGESVSQAKIELSAMWLRAQTEGTVLLIGLQTVFGRWPEDSAVSMVFSTSEVEGCRGSCGDPAGAKPVPATDRQEDDRIWQKCASPPSESEAS
jgi:hypothetical protein